MAKKKTAIKKATEKPVRSRPVTGLDGEFVINDDNAGSFVDKEDQGFAKGLVPRDYSQHPVGAAASSVAFSEAIELIPREKWPAMCAEQREKKSSLYHIRETGGPSGGRIPSLDQNGQGFCWIYSVTGCVQLLRAAAGMEYVELSPHSGACKIFGFQDRGAWGALALDFIAENGIAAAKDWPQKSMHKRHDNARTWKNAKKYRVTEGWIDLDIDHASEAHLNFDQVATLLLSRVPVVCDFNWWGHSVFAFELIDAYPELGQEQLDHPERWCIRIGNSWRDSWGDRGTAVLQGKRAIPNGGCAPRVVVAS